MLGSAKSLLGFYWEVVGSLLVVCWDSAEVCGEFAGSLLGYCWEIVGSLLENYQEFDESLLGVC